MFLRKIEAKKQIIATHESGMCVFDLAVNFFITKYAQYSIWGVGVKHFALS